jgi:prepilin-type processing-associated H-X9-DG protein
MILVDSVGRMLEVKQLAPNTLSTEVSLLSQNYQSPSLIVSAAYNQAGKGINVVWADGSLSQISLD